MCGPGNIRIRGIIDELKVHVGDSQGSLDDQSTHDVTASPLTSSVTASRHRSVTSLRRRLLAYYDW